MIIIKDLIENKYDHFYVPHFQLINTVSADVITAKTNSEVLIDQESDFENVINWEISKVQLISAQFCLFMNLDMI